MTQQDDWRPEMARLAQRQDQLERQQRETTTRVDALNRDVDRRMDSQRRDMNRQSKDRDWRVSSLERSRDTLENLFWFSMPLVAAAAVIIILVIAAIASREQRRECAKPEQRSPSSIDAPLAGSGGPLQPGFVAAGDTFPTTSPLRQHQRRPGDLGRRARELLSFNRSISYGKSKTYFISRGYRVGVEVCQANPAFSSVIGRVKFMERYGLSVHQAAALVLARRLLCCSERIPTGGSVPPATAYTSSSPYLQEAGEARVDVLGWGIGTAETGACSAAPAGKAETRTQSGSGFSTSGSPQGGLNWDQLGVPV